MTRIRNGGLSLSVAIRLKVILKLLFVVSKLLLKGEYSLPNKFSVEYHIEFVPKVKLFCVY